MKWIFALIRGLWWLLNAIRRTVGIVIAILIIGLFILFSREQMPPPVPSTAALIINPFGSLTDHHSADMFGTPEDVLNPRPPVASVQDIVDAIELARNDESIEAIVLELEWLTGGSLAQLQEIASALERFKTVGKPIYARGNYFSQEQYYLAAHADEVFMDPMGSIMLNGYGVYRSYMLEAIENIDAKVHVFKAGKYKSAVEPYLRNDMSEEVKTSNLDWLSDLWESYKNGVAKGRKVEANAVHDYVDNFGLKMEAAGGNWAQAALNAKLIDKMLSAGEFNALMIDTVGSNTHRNGYEVYNHTDYLSYLFHRRPQPEANDAVVGVVVAEGAIMDSANDTGVAGSYTLSQQLYKVAANDRYKALVLRVNSPGGSVFASEQIRRGILRIKQAGKPVIVSMGGMAASGGYWISMNADEIWASPTTVTGSIGVFGMMPNFSKSLKRVGIHNDGVGTTSIAASINPAIPMPEQLEKSMQASVEHSYAKFIKLAANGRDMSESAMDAIAQGRVWSGKDAKREGLVDELGTLSNAIASAAEKASISDKFNYEYVDLTQSFWATNNDTVETRLNLQSKLQANIGKTMDAWANRTIEQILGPVAPVLQRIKQDPIFSLSGKDRQHLYAHCRCEPQ